MIRDAEDRDAERLAEIYNHYIRETVATFEVDPIDVHEMRQRIQDVQKSGYIWLVAESNEKVLGYVYAKQWQPRFAYRHTVEISAYLAPEATSQGWGSRLYEETFARLKARSTHVVIAGITLPNPASIALHEKFGMRKVAHFEQVGHKFDRWLDVGHWQRTFP